MKKVLLGLLIWLVIPAGVAALGFFIIGPNIGRVPEARKGAQAVTDLVAASTGIAPVPSDAADAKTEKPEPKSKVDVDTDPIQRSRNKHRRSEVTVVKEGIPKEEVVPSDDVLPDGEGEPITEPEPDPENVSGEPTGV